MLLLLVVLTPDYGSKPPWIYQSTVQPPQIVKQFTSRPTNCPHFHKELQEPMYSANDRRKDFMFNHNKSDLRTLAARFTNMSWIGLCANQALYQVIFKTRYESLKDHA
jgi:hypothetical protein